MPPIRVPCNKVFGKSHAKNSDENARRVIRDVVYEFAPYKA